MQKIKKLSDREHILLRPSMYIGGIKTIIDNIHIYEDGKFVKKEILYNPGLLKIIYEIIDNSIDIIIKTNFKKGNKIKVEIKNNDIIVEDNCIGIPVEKDENGIYYPELAWGHPRAGSNFEGDRHFVGQNGIGSFLSNIYSTKFIAISKDGKKQFKGIWLNNASKFSKSISSVKTTGVKVQFTPDYKRFGMNGITQNEIDLVKTRLYIVKYTYPQIQLYFNGEKIDIKEINF